MEKDLANRQQLARCGYVTRTSKEVLKQLKDRKLHELFNHLDSDKVMLLQEKHFFKIWKFFKRFCPA